jgi:hypothetical protein
MIRLSNSKEPAMKKHLILFMTALAIHLLSVSCFAQRQVELIPSISVRGTYDDNIFLDNRDERSEYLTAVTPAITLNLLSENTKLGMNYQPTFVWYADYSENNTTRHQGTVSWEQQLSESVSLSLSDTYLNSEDPLEDVEDLDAERLTRNKYWTNRGRASLGFVFGAENRLDVGYRRWDRENTDPTLNDNTTHIPFMSLTYWFDIKNGIRLDYSYRDASYSLDDDFTGHEPGVRYLRRFSPQSVGYLSYTYTTRDYDGRTEDYVVHAAAVGLDHAFTPEYSISVRLGQYYRVNDVSDNNYGPNSAFFLTRAFARGSITVGADGGWEDVYVRRAVSGFRKYYGGSARANFRILERVTLFAGASYRWSEDDRDIVEKNIRGDCGVRWSFMRYASLSLSYRYADRNSDIVRDSYTNNRVMLLLNVSKPYRWL